MTYEDILYDARDGVAWITINRPEVRNAFRAKTVDELVAAFRAGWGDPEVGVVVLTGAGDKAFSAGGDQRERTGGGYTGDTGLGMDMHGLHGVIRAIPKPVIAMVNGYAIGGGHVLHVLCDLSIAADTAVFGQTGPRVGAFGAGVGSSYLARGGGGKGARGVRVLCRPLDAGTGGRWGAGNRARPPAGPRGDSLSRSREGLVRLGRAHDDAARRRRGAGRPDRRARARSPRAARLRRAGRPPGRARAVRRGAFIRLRRRRADQDRET